MASLYAERKVPFPSDRHSLAQGSTFASRSQAGFPPSLTPSAKCLFQRTNCTTLGAIYYSSHFADEESKAQRLVKVTEPEGEGTRPGFQICPNTEPVCFP